MWIGTSELFSLLLISSFSCVEGVLPGFGIIDFICSLGTVFAELLRMGEGKKQADQFNCSFSIH